MRILLIGGTRFLGRAVVSALAARGNEVVVLNRGRREPHPAAVGAIACDKNDRAAFGKALTRERWRAVIDTVLNADDLVFAIDALAGRIARFIHTGSIGVYAPAKRIPSRESDALSPGTEIYSFNAKLEQDQVLLNAHNTRAFPATILRMSNIYGPGDIPLDGWGGRRAEFFQMVRDGKRIPLPNQGLALLHPGHVEDLARSFLAALDRPEGVGQVYNIAGPRALTMAEYVRTVAAAMGVEADIESAAPEDILKRFPDLTNERGLLFACQHMCCHIAKARRELDWAPAIPLEIGMRENIEWMQENRLL
ncbi:MAG: NAD-dependent epimerase/dehydratase family protein [Kiritimatiellae bacterium]|nr:NAD-dependent epimerase/dehydratase family protein [Kiritimatiellia bacterium]